MLLHLAGVCSHAKIFVFFLAMPDLPATVIFLRSLVSQRENDLVYNADDLGNQRLFSHHSSTQIQRLTKRRTNYPKTENVQLQKASGSEVDILSRVRLNLTNFCRNRCYNIDSYFSWWHWQGQLTSAPWVVVTLAKYSLSISYWKW